MPSMTDAMGELAHSIVLLRRDRAETTALRRKATHDRSKSVVAQLRDAKTSRTAAAREYRAMASATNAKRARTVGTLLSAHGRARQARQRHRLDLATAQRRQLAAFMTDLTDSVGTLREGFRTGLDAQRAALKTAAKAVHQQLAETRRDRHGAGEAWHGRKPAAHSTAHAAERQHRPETHRPAETAGAGIGPAEKGTEPATRMTAAMGGTSAEASRHHEASPPHVPHAQSGAPARGPSGPSAPAGGGKSP